MPMVWKRSCPKCGDDMYYSNVYLLRRAIMNNTVCRRGNCKLPANGWIKKCPSCNDEMGYDKKWYYTQSVKNNTLCQRCCKKGRRLSDETKRQMSASHIGILSSDNAREKMSKNNCRFWKGKCGKDNPHFGKKYTLGKKHTDEAKRRMSAIQKTSWKNSVIRKKRLSSIKWNNISVDKGQLELLEKWNLLGFEFKPNYQVHSDNFLCYLDGYDKKRNVVLEYDSQYHFRIDIQKKDLVRQNKIIEILHPKKFWRYNSINKTWKDVLKGLR